VNCRLHPTGMARPRKVITSVEVQVIFIISFLI
jgi:hypothetical protein